MTTELSLLEWLKLRFAQPDAQRGLRFGLALAVGLVALFGLAEGNLWGGGALMVVALGLGAWGLSLRGESVPIPVPAPDSTSGGAAAPTMVPSPAAASPRSLVELWQPYRLAAVIVLAVAGQWIISYQRGAALWGFAFYAGALVALIALLIHEPALSPPARTFSISVKSITVRLWPLGIAAFSSLYAFWAAGDNQFRPGGVVAWVVSVVAWLVAAWDGPLPVNDWRERLASLARREAVELRITRSALIFLAVLAVGAYFRYARLDTIPPEMTSDHVEKLLDVGDLLNGQHKIFFERNTGREPLQFYAAALVISALHTGLTHLTLKIVTATAGFLTLPFVYWLGRELEDETFGWLATLFAGVSFWATAISRVGLRFPLTPLFVAPALLFLVRGLRRGTLNDFLVAGLFLGVGLYGYSTFRVAPILVLAVVAWFLLWPAARGRRVQTLIHTLLLAATTLVVFVPLLRYALDVPQMFWYRTLSRLSGGQAAAGSLLKVFLDNQWNGARIFNWLGDVVWVNTVPGVPVLDFVAGGLFILGLGYLVWRMFARRDWLAGAWLIAVPILMLPSTLSLTFPNENPSVVRIGGVIPVVFLIVAYPLWLLIRYLRAHLPNSSTRAALLILGPLLLISTFVNYDLYFVRYPIQYAASAENASELGAVIRDFANSIGSYDRAWVRPYPYWVDTRAVEMYAGNFGADAAIPKESLTQWKDDPLPKLFILHPLDQETIAILRQTYPAGRLSLRKSKIPGHDFLLYFVPGTQDLDEHSLPTP